MKGVSLIMFHARTCVISGLKPQLVKGGKHFHPRRQSTSYVGTFAEAHQHDRRKSEFVKVVLYIRLGAFLVHGTFDIDGEESGRRFFVGGRNWGEEQLIGSYWILPPYLITALAATGSHSLSF